MRGKKWQQQPAPASHPSFATSRPRGWPRLRPFGLASTGVGCPPAPASELARHLARGAPISASRPPIKARGERPPTLAAAAAAAAASSSSSQRFHLRPPHGHGRRRQQQAPLPIRLHFLILRRWRCRRPAARGDPEAQAWRPLPPRRRRPEASGAPTCDSPTRENCSPEERGRSLLTNSDIEGWEEKFMYSMHDLLNGQLWTFKYRYWPNNKSRMYVLENTGEYVRTHDLQLGDSIVIYKDEENNRFVIGAKKAGDQHASAVPQVDDHISALFPIFPVTQVDDYLSPMAPQVGMSAFVPQADHENHEIFDGILNSLPEIPVADVRYSDFFDPFDDCMDMTATLNANQSANLHVTDEKPGHSLFPNPKSGPHT
ncbi:hypothetical protein GUJ93_ZPchr0007g5901 [Zizania palustris]|uniref:TF-B3 domain-containing protein n=1 Tax=Zizania palustris TaxID=103762 RepID=A0A8J5VXV5_ZIZPA|nr:hypothetical protein GUJ93_ZPchr0007g5901 [Zizania palustris]KAG8077716.1 hypothetical protein GUJ93_ZPchr0007g5901 [Zizania palustris]